MDLIILMIAILGIATSIANKKKAAEAQKKRTSFPDPGTTASGAAPGRNPNNRSTSPKASTSTKSTTLSRTPSAPGTSKWPWPEQSAGQKQKKASDTAYGGTPRYTHVVTSTLEGGHTHTESSMTGEEDCPPPKAAHRNPAEEKMPAAQKNTGALVDFQPNSVLQGVLYAEILGKPKALQRK